MDEEASHEREIHGRTAGEEPGALRVVGAVLERGDEIRELLGPILPACRHHDRHVAAVRARGVEAGADRGAYAAVAPERDHDPSGSCRKRGTTVGGPIVDDVRPVDHLGHPAHEVGGSRPFIEQREDCGDPVRHRSKPERGATGCPWQFGGMSGCQPTPQARPYSRRWVD